MRIKKVKICSTYYDVKYSKEVLNTEGETLIGDIDFNETIRISLGYPRQKQLQAIIHESTHGITEEYRLGMDEQFTLLFSNALYAFIIDNPKLIKEILRYTKKIRR